MNKSARVSVVLVFLNFVGCNSSEELMLPLKLAATDFVGTHIVSEDELVRAKKAHAKD